MFLRHFRFGFSMHVSQIFISATQEALPPALVTITNATRRIYSGHDYSLYTDESLRDFIAGHFGGDVLRAYDSLRPFAFKADLGRLCLLLERGGLYLDIAVQPLRPLIVDADVKAILFRDLNLNLPYGWGVSNTLMYAKARCTFLVRAIEMIVANCKTQNYCATPFSISGPGLIGQALAASGEDPQFMYGDRLPLTPLHPQKNFAFVLPSGDIVAWGKKVGNGGDLTSFGMTGANDYMKMWKARDVFNAF
jgi:hypothetical protein